MRNFAMLINGAVREVAANSTPSGERSHRLNGSERDALSIGRGRKFNVSAAFKVSDKSRRFSGKVNAGFFPESEIFKVFFEAVFAELERHGRGAGVEGLVQRLLYGDSPAALAVKIGNGFIIQR